MDEVIGKQAKKLGIEGTAQIISGQIHIVVCGTKEKIDQFLDVVHAGISKLSPTHVEIEPFLKTRDYRGVFRIIE